MMSLKMVGRGLTHAVSLAVAVIGLTVSAAPRRPMAIQFMLDGLRADVVESGQMPNVEKLMKGAWQPGYAAAWTLFARTVPESTVSAPNHVSIATGATVSHHGVEGNGQTANGNYTSHPTWLTRVVQADTNRRALFAYSWSEDGSLGPAIGVSFLFGTDAENAAAVPTRLAASDAPDATMLFIDCPDAGGHSGGYYPYSSAYLTNVKTADNTIGACLAAIAARPTFAEEDWLVVVTSDHGGFSTSHSSTHAAQASTVPIVVAGLNVVPGEIPGRPYNYDPTANLLAHFGLGSALASVDAKAVAGTSTATRTFADALAVYLPFSDGTMTNLAPNATVTAEPSESGVTISGNGFAGKGLAIAAGGKVKLAGSQSLPFEDGEQSFTVAVWVRQNQNSFKDSQGKNLDAVIWGNKDWNNGANKGLALVASSTRAGIDKMPGICFNYVGSARYDIGNFINEGATLWAFYAVTRTGDGVLKVYQGRRDGALCWVAENGASMTTSSTGYPFWLGSDGLGTYKHKYVGELDDFALWTRGLSHDEIKRIYENGRRGLEFGELLEKEKMDQPTLAVTGYDGTTATLAVGGTRTESYTLCVASGAADKDDDKYAWDNFATVAEIAPTTQQYVYTLPAEFKSEKRKFRFFLMKTAGLPYTKELQYLQSAGSSAVDTQVCPRSGTSVELDVAATTTESFNWFFGSFCRYNDTVAKRGNFGMAFHAFDKQSFYHEITGGNVDLAKTYTLNTDYHVKFSVTAVTVDGVTEATGQTAAGFFEHGYPIELFRNRKDLVAYDKTLKGRIGEVTLRADGETVRDLMPVVDADGKGAYFDSVCGRLHPEVAGTAFTLGTERDSTRQGWVRSVTETLDGDAARLVTAWWTGLGTAGDFTDPKNWACTNAIGVGVDGAVPTAETTVYVSGKTTFAVPAGTTLFSHAGGIVFQSACLAAECDWSGLSLGDIAAGSAIDLAGHALQLVGTADGTPNAFTVTDTSVGTPGELHVSVAEDVTFPNNKIAIAGNLRLVKDGPGALQASAADQTYAGGTEIVAGKIVCGSQIGAAKLFGSAGSEIAVCEGAFFDLYGKKGAETYLFVLDGGTVMNTTTVDNNDAMIGSIRLLSDSTILLPNITYKHDISVVANSVWDLGGKTLSVRLLGADPDLCFKSAPVTVRNGTLKTVEKTGWLQDVIGITAEGDVTYDYSHILRQKANTTVKNFICRTTSDNVQSYDADLKNQTYLTVTGRFAPMTAYFCNVRLANGSTLDLRERTGVWSVKCHVYISSKKYDATTSFPADGRVTVDLAGRTDLAQGLKVVDFAGTSVPETTVFETDAETAGSYMFERKSDGLYLTAFIKTAQWTGGAGDGATTNSANWECRDANGNVVADALPSFSTTAFVPADATNFNFPSGQLASLGELRFLGDTYTLNADADWSGIRAGLVSKYPATIDVNGYTLTMSEDPVTASDTTDLTTPGGNVRIYCGDKNTLHGDSAKLVDNKPENASRFLSPSPFAGCRIDYDFGEGEGRVVRGVRFYCAPTYAQRRPNDLTVYGTASDPATAADGDWTQLGSWNELDLAINAWSDYLHFDNETPYRAYRLKINNNKGGYDGYGTYLELYEMELVACPPMAPKVTSGVAGGTLTFDVPAGKTVQIDNASLGGLLKVLKTGAGTLVFGKANQTYTGGTEVAGGAFMFAVSSTSTTPLGPWGAAITVNAGGTLDLNGVGCMKNYELTLAGGTLQNSGGNRAEIGNLVLTDDSTISFPKNVAQNQSDMSVAVNAEWDLGGHLLTIAFAGIDPDLFFGTAPTAKIHNGTIKTTGEGFFNDYIGVDASDRVTYDFANKLRLRANASVSNFICRTTSNSVCSRTDNGVPVYLELSGTFTPLSKWCYNMRLLDGATIDLSTYDTAWQLEFWVDYGGGYTTRTDFADGATIKVDLGARTFKERTKVITWTKAPANLSTLHFRSADGQYSLKADPDGVWAAPKTFMIILR